MEEILATSEEWAYLAGIIDGEGTVGVYQRSGAGRDAYKYFYMLRIFNTDRALIDWVSARFGGNTRRQNRGKAGEAFGKKPVYMVDWRNPADVGTILRGVLPYLVIKKLIAEATIHLSLYSKEENELMKYAYTYYMEVKNG